MIEGFRRHDIELAMLREDMGSLKGFISHHTIGLLDVVIGGRDSKAAEVG
jgi:hypothetical protein